MHTDDAHAAQVREHHLWVLLCRDPASPRAAAFREMIQEDTGVDDSLLDALLAEETGQAAPAAATSSEQTPACPARPDLSREEWAAFTAPAPPATRDFALRETTLGLAGETDEPWAGLARRFGRIVLADRLREVRALSGFTRVSPDATVVPADTSRRLKWLPAVEVFGEGISSPSTATRSGNGGGRGGPPTGRRHARRPRPLVPEGPPGECDRARTRPRFVLLHTLAHLLIRQLSFESGYTTASLRERIYARPDQDQYGILVYTAAGDAEGTLGGLVRQGEPPRLAEHCCG
ncbi:Zn-binding domain-containing protein [Streptomyces sp. INA 01156]